MESTGEPQRLQTMKASRCLLDQMHSDSNITTEWRGLRTVKGRGEIMTYWVIER